MPWDIRNTSKKPKCVNKSLYLPEALARRVETMARANNTSFNNIVVSMIAACLEDAPRAEGGA